MIGMMAAISTVLMFLEIRVPFAPEFIKLDFSELPIVLCAFIYGPVAGILTAVIKIALILLLRGTSTMGVGEITNLVCSLCYFLPAIFVYRKVKDKKGAAIGLVLGTCITSIIALFANYFVMYPLYAKLFGMPMDVIVGAASAVNPLVHNLFTLMVCTMLPFNILKFGIVSVLVFLVYKKLAVVFRKFAA